MKITIELYIDEPISNDIDELTDIVTKAIDDSVGESDFVIADVGLAFEIDDA